MARAKPPQDVIAHERLGLTPTQAVTVVLGVCVVVGAALRFVALGDQSLGHDEAVTVGRVLRPGLGATLREVGSSERTPYLYYVAAWLWTRVCSAWARPESGRCRHCLGR